MDVFIHTKPGCPHCDRAKEVVKQAGHEVVEICYETDEEIAVFKAKFEGATFPRVFIDGELVGGADDTVAYFDTDF